MKKKYPVLLLVQYLSPGGIEWMVARLASSLKDDSEFEPHLIVYDHNKVDQIDSYFIQNGIHFTRLQKKEGFSFSLIFTILSYCRRHRIKLIHTHHLGAMMYSLLVKCFSLGMVKVIYTQHSFIHLSRFPRYIWFERFFAYFSDSVTAVSRQVFDEFKQLKILTRGPVRLIPNGSLFADNPVLDKDHLKSLRTQLIQQEGCGFLSDHIDKNWLIYLGRVHNRKGQDHALKAWNSLNEDQRKNTVLLFLGPITDQNLRLTFTAEVDKVSSAYYVGSTHRSVSWYQAADHFFSFSESEGWPLAPMEAIGSGCPATLSDIEGHRMYKEKCHLVVTSEFGYKNAVIKVIQELNEQDFSKSRFASWSAGEDYRNRHSIQSMKDQYQRLFYELLE